jgi:hypothetical protein
VAERAVERSALEALSLRRFIWRGLTLPQLWAFVAVCLPFVSAFGFPMRAGDSAYQVVLGNMMLRTHDLVRSDPFTFTMFGHPWLNQQWGDGIVYALAFRVGGWEALSVLRAGLVGVTFLFVYLACRTVGASMKRAAILTLCAFAVAAAGMSGLMSLRPQLFGTSLFALTLWLVVGRRSHPRRLWAIPFVVAAWANLHGSFFLGPLLVGLAWLQDRHERSDRARETLLVAVVSALATGSTPFGYDVWRYAWDLSTNPHITRFVTEWRPPSLGDPDGLAFFASAIAVAVVVARAKERLAWPALLWLGVFFVMALPAVRGIYWWALAVPPILAGLPEHTSRRRSNLGMPALNTAIAATVLVVGIALSPWWRTSGDFRHLLTDAPIGATQQLTRVMSPGDRVFAAQRYGSWLEFHFPRNPVFVDTRFELFPGRIWRDYATVSHGLDGWQGVLDRWHVDVLVASRLDQRDLIPRLRTDPAWRLTYADNEAAVFTKRSRT